MKKGKKLGFVTLGLVAAVVAVAVSSMGAANADKYSSVTTNSVKAFVQEESTAVTATQSPEQDTQPSANCTHQGERKAVVTKESKCTKNGMIEYRCGDCDKLMTKEVTPSTGHNYDENELCRNCGEYKTPRLWAKYEIDGAIYKVTNPLSNGWGNVTFVEQKDKDVKKADVPKEVEINGADYQVTKIDDKAFAGCENMTKVSIGKEVKTIGKKAFADCDRLKTVDLGSGVEKIEKQAFADCNALKDVKFGKNVKEIGNEAFSNCKELKEIDLGKNVKEIGKEAFVNCANLKKATLGEGVKKIDKYAFRYCGKLEKINIKSTVLKTIGEGAFEGISKNAKFTLNKTKIDILKVLFTAETGVTDTMSFEAKTSVWDYFSQDEEGNVEVEDTAADTTEIDN